MLNPTISAGSGGSGGGPAPTPSPSGFRTYIGSREIFVSGTWNKAADLASILAAFDPALVEVDIECVGGGGAGPNNSYQFQMGGEAAPPAFRLGMRFADLPDTATVIIGAGGANTQWAGGNTVFGDLLLGRGGMGGFDIASSYAAKLTFELRTYLTGPGHGAGYYASPGGGNAFESSAAYPDRRRAPGNSSGQGGFQADGLNARTPFEYGSGGGFGAEALPGGYRGGKGGVPGGGGGSTPSTSYQGGPGGAGVARLHYFTRGA